MKKLLFLSAFIFAGLAASQAAYFSKSVQVMGTPFVVNSKQDWGYIENISSPISQIGVKFTSFWINVTGFNEVNANVVAYGRSTPYESSDGQTVNGEELLSLAAVKKDKCRMTRTITDAKNVSGEVTKIVWSYWVGSFSLSNYSKVELWAE